MTNQQQVEILLVEDNPTDAELTLRAFKARNFANQVFVARDGAEALDFFFGDGSHPLRDIGVVPKVVLLDLKLPKVDGPSSREEPDIASAYRLGANSYIVKPVDFEAFARAVSEVGLYWLLLNEPPH